MDKTGLNDRPLVDPPVSDRVAYLRERVFTARPEVFDERAILVTEAHKDSKSDLVVIKRAKALDRILRKSAIDIHPGELIVGIKAPLPKGSPIYPEFNVNWMEDELDSLADRAQTPFWVNEQTKSRLRNDVIPFWKGRTVFDRIVENAPDEAFTAADEGLFFHYFLDRSIGHVTVNYEKVLHLGLTGLKGAIQTQQARLSERHPEYTQKINFYNALAMVADAVIAFAHRYSEMAGRLATDCQEPVRQKELEQIARVCRRVPEQPASSFYEALQSFWFVHLVLNLESNGYAISPGRFCQYMYPFYEADLNNKAINDFKAQELIDCLWIKFNELTVVKAGATAKASNTYVDFQNLNVGGLTEDGRDGTNAVSYLCLNALDRLTLPQPQLSCLISSKTEKAFLQSACEVIRKGTGMPAMFNDDVKVISLMASGKTLVDARKGGVNGCVEVNAQGCDNMASTGYVNLVKCLELALNNGLSMTTGTRMGPSTGKIAQLTSFDHVWRAFNNQLTAAVELKVSYDKAARRAFANHCPVIFTSLVMDDCITKGADFHLGGARYNAPMMCGVGLGTLTDSLAAIKEVCFTQKQYSLSQVHEAMVDNYASQPLLQKLLWKNCPKFGNNNDEVDQIAADVVNLFGDILSRYENQWGEAYRANMIPTTTHIPMGHLTAASADGRFAEAPLSEGVSPVQGQDLAGPTAVVLSLARLDHARTAGTLLNQKMAPSLLAGQERLSKFADLIRTYFDLGGYHMQFNVVSKKTLLAAQEDPQSYRSLIVRVAGYSDYFVSLSKDVQDEIIMRTSHGVE